MPWLDLAWLLGILLGGGDSLVVPWQGSCHLHVTLGGGDILETTCRITASEHVAVVAAKVSYG